MAVIERTLVINAPVSKVMTLTNDPARHHEWLPGVVKVEATPGQQGRVGEVWIVTFSMMGMRSKAKATILEWEENKRVVWKQEGGFEGRQTLLFEAAGNGSTRVTNHIEFRFKGLMGLLGPLMILMMKRNARRAGNNLKRLCEAEAKG